MSKYTKPIDSAIEFIKKVHSLGIKNGIVTSDSKESTMLTLNHFNWTNLFEAVIGRESTPEHKESGIPAKNFAMTRAADSIAPAMTAHPFAKILKNGTKPSKTASMEKIIAYFAKGIEHMLAIGAAKEISPNAAREIGIVASQAGILAEKPETAAAKRRLFSQDSKIRAKNP